MSSNYTTSVVIKKELKPILFDIVKDYSKYKNFIPWCLNSYQKKNNDNHQINRFLNLVYTSKNFNFKNGDLIFVKNTEEEKIKNVFINKIEEGLLTIGIGMINFEYSSYVLQTDKMIYSIVDNESSNIFSKLESIWEFNDTTNSKHFENINNQNQKLNNKINLNNKELEANQNSKENDKITVKYTVSFDFKDSIYKHLSHLIVNNLSSKLVNIFLKQMNEINENKQNCKVADLKYQIEYIDNEDLKRSLKIIYDNNLIDEKRINNLLNKIQKRSLSDKDIINLIDLLNQYDIIMKHHSKGIKNDQILTNNSYCLYEKDEINNVNNNNIVNNRIKSLIRKEMLNMELI